MSSESSSSSGLLSTPPSGVDFLHRLRTDPKSHHITIGSGPAHLHTGKEGRASPAPRPLQRLSSSEAHTPEQTPELEIDDPHHVHGAIPVSEAETLHALTPPFAADDDDDDPALDFQTRNAFLASDGETLENGARSGSGYAAGYGSPPISPKTDYVPVIKPTPQSATNGGREPPRRPMGVAKRSHSDFAKPSLSSEELPAHSDDRQRRQTVKPPPHLSLGSNGKADWQGFCVAYAAGMWNPNYTPQPPHGPSGRYSTDVIPPAPQSGPPNHIDLGSPTSSAPPVPLDSQWASFQQNKSSGVGSLPSSHSVQPRNSSANPSDTVFSVPNPEREHVDPFDPQEPPRKMSEGAPNTNPMLPAMQANSTLPRSIEEEQPNGGDDTLIDTFVSMTLGPREKGPSASVAEMTGGEEEDGYSPFSQDHDPMDEFRDMPQYADFILDFPTINHPTDMAVFYRRFGFLPAPMGPRELERRKALYNFNILHTAKDMNFDRITHICKLMFNTKMVVMSLLDSDTSWYKSTSGLDLSQSARVTGFCSHTILGNSDEPMVVLDSMKDWRFARNPHVMDAPNIRFFAGAPLRTSDGHNLGALCLIDDKPWDEFSPRSRLILKELAMVVMRELELWRDKLQLRTRGKIQTSMEKFARDCLTIDEKLNASALTTTSRMAEVYSRAAKLISKTLDLDGCTILDISQFERLQSTDALGNQHTIYHANPFSGSSAAGYEMAESFGAVSAFPILAAAGPDEPRTRPLTPEEHQRMSKFLEENRDGRIYENIVPTWIRYVFPSSLKYGMVVPLLDMDQQPFAMICAHTQDRGKQFLEGYELQFLRAIGVIILSAVLQRRMALANRSKSVLISSVSHELRTPLHGILAAAELLTDTKLDSNQEAFLSTVRTCGLQLIDTVNHVLDFTKLSADSKNGTNSRRQIQKQTVNLSELLHSTVESCWLGQRARLMQLGEAESDLGSYYAPVPMGLVPQEQRLNIHSSLANVETVLDIGFRQDGWNVVCEPGGLRRIIMNLYGNSVKFTKEGYVQVALRELPHPAGARRIPIELSVVDTGKGISKSFLKDQLFQPFSQENPLQPGTGLGLAIVNTIVRSEGMDGNLEVWSAEGVGTEIKVTFEVDLLNPNEEAETLSPSPSDYDPELGNGFSVAFIGFSPDHRGHQLLSEVMTQSSGSLGFSIVGDLLQADIIIANETYALIPEVVEILHSRALIVLSSIKGQDKEAIRRLAATEGHIGLWHKPLAPCMFIKEMMEAVNWLANARLQRASSCAASTTSVTPGVMEPPPPSLSNRPPLARSTGAENTDLLSEPKLKSQPGTSMLNHPQFKKQSTLSRRHSDEHKGSKRMPTRPSLGPRGITYDGHRLPAEPLEEDPPPDESKASPSATASPGSAASVASSTIPLGDGGAMLRAVTMTPALAALRRQSRPRVMVVEDNAINRRVLTAFLRKKGFSHTEAVDGAKGVELFRDTPPSHWDVILMDINMPIMDGLDATRAIRNIEASRRHSCKLNGKLRGMPSSLPDDEPRLMGNEFSGKGAGLSAAEYTPNPRSPPKSSRAHDPTHVKIFALTGLATSDDKRTAFNAGVDGYLVKPVSLSSLDVLFKKIGF